MSAFVSRTFNAQQSATVLVACPSAPGARLVVNGVVFTCSNKATNDPMMMVLLGSTQLFCHPNVPSGGGASVTDLSVKGGAGDDIKFSCDAPTGGDVSVLVTYSVA